MLTPAFLTITTPLVTGVLFGVKPLLGLLVGSLLSSLPLATSLFVSGAAWDNAKNLISSAHTEPCFGTDSDAYRNSIIGDAVGDPMQDLLGY